MPLYTRHLVNENCFLCIVHLYVYKAGGTEGSNSSSSSSFFPPSLSSFCPSLISSYSTSPLLPSLSSSHYPQVLFKDADGWIWFERNRELLWIDRLQKEIQTTVRERKRDKERKIYTVFHINPIFFSTLRNLLFYKIYMYMYLLKLK